MSRPRASAALAALSLCAAACGPQVRVAEQALAGARPRRLAVLPFTVSDPDPERRDDRKAAALSEQVARHLATSRYLVLDPDEVARRLRGLGLEDPRAIAQASFRQLGPALGVDALVRGEVTRIYNLQVGLVYRQRLAVRVLLEDARTGRHLARIEHGVADTGGLLVGWSQSVEAIEGTVQNAFASSYLHLAAELAREVSRAFPASLRQREVPLPTLRRASIARTRSGLLVAGDALTVTVEADPGLRATLRLGLDAAALPLPEEAPGVYRVRRRVQPGGAFCGHPVVQVRDAFGAATGCLLPELAIDARPPGAPRELRVAGRRAGDVIVSWSPPSGDSVAVYRVYGVDRFSQATLLGEVPRPGFRLPAHRAVRLAVAAVDAAGNHGPLARVALTPRSAPESRP